MLVSKIRSREDAYRHDLRGYQAGFILAAILTIIPFALVASGTFSTIATLWVIGVIALIQIAVHIRYFLHVDLSPERREELYLMLFSGALVTLMIAGMLWLLFNLHTRMM
ncbi:cytochrome bo3 quinol oxidase subunit 4 [Bradyrhizobium erythrophlei]|jgi:cytochrome o ubiquinol oxidase operon protein cyoD|nr:cytochrome bo3 quinol oxidase subunit 4 [Bradyrhizobium erythrophlei]